LPNPGTDLLVVDVICMGLDQPASALVMGGSAQEDSC